MMDKFETKVDRVHLYVRGEVIDQKTGVWKHYEQGGWAATELTLAAEWQKAEQHLHQLVHRADYRELAIAVKLLTSANIEVTARDEVGAMLGGSVTVRPGTAVYTAYS